MEEIENKNEYSYDELLESFESNRDEISSLFLKIMDASEGYSANSTYVGAMAVAYGILGICSFDEMEIEIYKLAAMGYAKKELNGIARQDSIEIAKYGFGESKDIENAIIHF